jgi:hypothetical protein
MPLTSPNVEEGTLLIRLLDMVATIALDDFSWQRRVGIAAFVTFAPYGAIRSGLAGSVAFGRRSAFSSFSETSFFSRRRAKVEDH